MQAFPRHLLGFTSPVPRIFRHLQVACGRQFTGGISVLHEVETRVATVHGWEYHWCNCTYCQTHLGFICLF